MLILPLPGCRMPLAGVVLPLGLITEVAAAGRRGGTGLGGMAPGGMAPGGTAPGGHGAGDMAPGDGFGGGAGGTGPAGLVAGLAGEQAADRDAAD